MDYDVPSTAVIALTHEIRCDECGTSEVRLVAGGAAVSGYYLMTYVGNDEPAVAEIEVLLGKEAMRTSLRDDAVQAVEMGLIHRDLESSAEAAVNALLDWVDANAWRVAKRWDDKQNGNSDGFAAVGEAALLGCVSELRSKD